MTSEHRGVDHLVRRTWGLLGALTLVALTIAGAIVDRGAALSAATGVGLVAILFGVSVALLRWTAHRPDATFVILLGGLGLRIGAYLLALDAVSTTGWVHGPSLALATVTAFAITLVAELVWLARTPQLFMIDPAPRASGLDRTPELML